MLSDNINKDFGSDVAYETEQQRRDGKVVVRQKGTLQILDEWLRKTFRTSDWELWDAAIKAFRELRQLRQKPAHALDEDVFDQRYIKDQRELMVRVSSGLRTLRMIFSNHPRVRQAGMKIPDWLEGDKILTR